MHADGVAVFSPPGSRLQRVAAVALGTSPEDIAEAWTDALRRLNAPDIDELRAAGWECRLVRMAALGESETDLPRLVDDCVAECEAQSGDLTTVDFNISIAIPTGVVPLPEFRGCVLTGEDADAHETEVFFELTRCTETQAEYRVRLWDEIAVAHSSKTRIAPSQRVLETRQWDQRTG